MEWNKKSKPEETGWYLILTPSGIEPCEWRDGEGWGYVSEDACDCCGSGGGSFERRFGVIAWSLLPELDADGRVLIDAYNATQERELQERRELWKAQEVERIKEIRISLGLPPTGGILEGKTTSTFIHWQPTRVEDGPTPV